MEAKNKYCKNAYESLSDNQIKYIEDNCDKLLRKDIALNIGIPEARLKRASSYIGWSFSSRFYTKDFKEEVIKYYEKNGGPKTRQKYKNASTRSIIERNDHLKLNIFWEPSEIIMLLRLGPFLPFEKQAKYFKKNKRTPYSIKTYWDKNMPCSPSRLHGLPEYKAKIFSNINSMDAVKICLQKEDLKNNINLYLWTDLFKNLNRDCSSLIFEYIKSMDLLQRWLYDGDAKEKLKKITGINLWM